MSEDQDNIPSSKVQRAGRFFKTGVKVSGNYLKHYSKKAFNADVSRSDLDKKNADDIFNMLTQLKGTALKIAQMLSMDNSFLPQEYTDKFKEAQFNNKALSGPLIVNTFRKYSGKTPSEMFDKFNPDSVRAASIGQVHEAWKDGKKLAVKIQYPGVADSIQSDINMVKPLFLRAFNIKSEDIEVYLNEIVGKLVEETDYEHELENALKLTEKCKSLDYIFVPQYYKALSNKRVLTMDWMEGLTLTEFLKTETNQEERNRVGQQLLDFTHFQLHTLKEFHADFHPGNFMVLPNGQLGVIDFGCVKALPGNFYHDYFAMLKSALTHNDEKLLEYMGKLDFLRPEDDEKTHRLFYDATVQTIQLVAHPLMHDSFDFGDNTYFEKLAAHGKELSGKKEFRSSKAIRGPQDAIYLHRTFFGLYNVLNDLKAKVNMDNRFFDAIDL
jgi:predicted unusual protein kinase regulating ubiquinone biosynthesis (AarF/ABC1/UbiB family)